MDIILKILLYIIEVGLFAYTLILFSFYIVLALFSAIAMRYYLRKNSYVDFEVILSSPITPSVSVIAPCYNESRSIVENIRSLLSIHYNNFDVIIVNDGSSDDSLQKMIEAYSLIKVDFAFEQYIATQEVRGIYKSLNKSYSKLIVVDKVNGGKADALNAGINISNKSYFAAIDVDSIIEEDALLRMIKPFLEESNGVRTIATGGVIRVANSCVIENGKILEVKVPEKFLSRVQVLEYTRSFLMGRMAWSKLNGLLLISGAFGIFDREIVLKSGGYNKKTVGEDMELVFRMRRYMIEHKLLHRVVYIPDPLCWTEVPSDLKTFGKQRNRWTRGLIETLKLHKKIAFNPKYGKMGTLGYPFWFFFEWLAPFVEVIGIIYFIIIAILGLVNWVYFAILLAFVYFFAVSFSFWAILYEESSFPRYKRKRDMIKLMITSLFEPFLYHPLTVFYALKGNFDAIRGKKGWGKMERKGFEKK